MQDRTVGGLGRTGAYLFWAVASILYALPLAVALAVDADLTTLANEAIAYRYFTIERIRNGEGGNVWLPQGQTTSAAQKPIATMVDLTDKALGLSLRERLNLFGDLSLALNAALVAILFALVAQRSDLGWDARIPIALLVLLPIYAAGLNGFHLHVTPDYQAVSTVLLGFGLYAVLLNERLSDRTKAARAGIQHGVLAGLLIGNKITLAPATLLIALLTILRSRVSLRSAASYLAILISLSLAVLALVLLVFYDFRPHALREMYPRWLRFVTDPGAEPNFWEQLAGLVRLYLGFAIAYVLAAAVLYVASVTHKRQWSLYRVATILSAGVVLAACAVYVIKRPAQSTFFEVFVLVLFVSSVLFGTAPLGSWHNRTAILLATAWMAVVLHTFPMKPAIDLLRFSRQMGDERWTLFEDTLRMASGRPVLAIIPTNEFAHQGVYELLLKASATFPTWYMDPRGHSIIDRHHPQLKFFHEYGAPQVPLSSAISDSQVVLWFDRLDLAPLSLKYEELARLLRSDDFGCQSGELSNFGVRSIKWWRCERSS
jgi:hypothetical protein